MVKLVVSVALIMFLLSGSSFATECFFEDAQIGVSVTKVSLFL